MQTERRHIEGTAVLTAEGGVRAIAIPLLPLEGTWTVTGTITQAAVGLASNAVTWNVQWGGRCHAGTTTNDATNLITSNPSVPPTYAPAAPIILNLGNGAGGVNQYCPEIELTNPVSTSYASWSLDCVVTSAP